MLYRGSEITREVAWVIFDEIHYLRDKGNALVRSDQKKRIPSPRTGSDLGGNDHSLAG